MIKRSEKTDRALEARFGKPDYFRAFLHPKRGTMCIPLGKVKLYREESISEYNLKMLYMKRG